MACELVVMPDLAFEKARERLKQIIVNLRELASEAASILSKMSSPQLKIIKRDFKGIWSADQIDRLVLFGRGRISVHLAVRQKCLPASLLRRLPEETLSIVNNPEQEIELWDARGVKSKRVKDLTAFDFGQLINKKGKIRSITEQQKISLQPVIKIDERDIEEPESMKVDGSYLLIKGKTLTMKVRIKDLRKFVA